MTAELRNGDVLKVFRALAEKWQLSSEEQERLLAISSDDYSALSNFADQSADRGLAQRITQLASIQKAVDAIAPIEHSKTLLTSLNATAPLNGTSVREYLLTRNTDADFEALAHWLNSKVYGR